MNDSTSEMTERFNRLCEMQDRLWRSMPPADKDRILQSHLAAARSPSTRLTMVCKMTDSLRCLRRAAAYYPGKEGGSGGR